MVRYMTNMTISEAIEQLRDLVSDEDAVWVEDGAQTWELSCLLDAVRAAEDGTVHDLAVSEDGIVRINPDGYLEGYLYRVVPRPGSYVWELRKNGRTLLARAYQSARDFAVNGRGEMLAAMIPSSHTQQAQEGEWNPEGFLYSVGEDYYVVSCQRVLDEDPDKTGPSERYPSKRYVCVELENDRRYGLVTDAENWEDETDGIPWVDAPVINWGDYVLFLTEEGRTAVRDVREYPWTDQGLAEAAARGDLRIFDERGDYISPDDDEDARRVAEAGGLAAWTKMHGVELP